MTDVSNCEICGLKESKYSCPRCTIPYCSVSCYQSEKHFQCSEAFYEKCVQEELKNQEVSDEAKQRMLNILKQQNLDSDSEESLDSDDDEELPDLASRMADVNLDDEDAVWDKLTAEEKEEFKKLITTGNILKILPDWEPWWKIKRRITLIEECDSTEPQKETFCPVIPQNIPPLTKLTKSEPSPNVAYMVLNVLSSYSFSVRWFKGNHDSMPVEAITTINFLSATLKSNQVFTNAIAAFSAFEEDVAKCDWIKTNEYEKNLTQEDLLDIINGSDENDPFFCLKAALSDINNLCVEAIKILKHTKTNHVKRFSGEPPKVNQIQMISKKMSYYLSWSLSHGTLLRNVMSKFV